MEGGVTKNSKKVEAGKKGYQARLLKMKEKILSGTTGTTPGTTSGTTTTTSGTDADTFATTTATTSVDVYMYGVGL